MNTYLEKLFDKYRLSDKDRYEVRQIFALLPIDKQRNLISNFEPLAYKLKQIEQDVQAEREILLGTAVDTVREAIEDMRAEKAISQSKIGIESLKSQM